jgi:thioredoxin 1
MDNVLRVACLCAQWCGVCRDYAALFAQVRQVFAEQAQFLWIDVEDQADQLEGVDVENFPTLLIARGESVLFFGAITPHTQTLTRLIKSALTDTLEPQVIHPEIKTLVCRLSDLSG